MFRIFYLFSFIYLFWRISSPPWALAEHSVRTTRWPRNRLNIQIKNKNKNNLWLYGWGRVYFTSTIDFSYNNNNKSGKAADLFSMGISMRKNIYFYFFFLLFLLYSHSDKPVNKLVAIHFHVVHKMKTEAISNLKKMTVWEKINKEVNLDAILILCFLYEKCF